MLGQVPGANFNIYLVKMKKRRKKTVKIYSVLFDFSLTVKAATLIFRSWRGSAISSAKEGKSGFI